MDAGILIFDSDSQSLKANWLIVALLSTENSTVTSFEHSLKASSPIVSTDGGIDIEHKDLQLANAKIPRAFRPDPVENCTSRNAVHRSKQEYPMISTVEGILMRLRDEQLLKTKLVNILSPSWRVSPPRMCTE